MRNANTPAKAESAADRYSRYHDIVRAVIRTYVETKQLSPLVACEIDQDAPPNKRLTVNAVCHLADIEIATAKALQGKPELQAAWFQLALENPVEAKLEQQVVKRCGPLYAARGLEPWFYFRPSVRRGSRTI